MKKLEMQENHLNIIKIIADKLQKDIMQKNYKVLLEDKTEDKDILSPHFHSTKHCQTKVEQQGTDICKCNEMEKKV